MVRSYIRVRSQDEGATIKDVILTVWVHRECQVEAAAVIAVAIGTLCSGSLQTASHRLASHCVASPCASRSPGPLRIIIIGRLRLPVFLPTSSTRGLPTGKTSAECADMHATQAEHTCSPHEWTWTCA